MSKKHDALYNDVLGNLDAPEPAPPPRWPAAAGS